MTWTVPLGTCIIIIDACCIVPSGSPQSFTGYLSHLTKSASFRWSTVAEGKSNGLLIGYNFSCNYSSDKGNSTVNMNFGNTTFQFKLEIVENAEYECVVAASTNAGRGPITAPVYFTTPGNIEGTHFTSDFCKQFCDMNTCSLIAE